MKTRDDLIETCKEKFVRDYQFNGTLEEKVDASINYAYDDVKRTLAGIGDHKDCLNKAKSGIKESIINYLNLKNDSKPFSKVHDELCDIWINSFNNTQNLHHYGKAQKIINMTFKYLYCTYREDEQYKDKFNDCHMPLDNYVLKWCKKYINKDISDEGWSKLEKPQYDKLQELIRKNIDQNVHLLDAEFVIWEKEKELYVNKELISCSKKLMNSINKDDTLYECLEEYNRSKNEDINSLNEILADFSKQIIKKV